MIALLSIKPEFVKKIFSGEKVYEYRKAIFKPAVEKVVVYCTKPVGMIVGEFEVGEILEGCPEEIWEKTKNCSGIHEAFFLDYFQLRKKGYAINIAKTRVYDKAIEPSDVFGKFIPPQSFFYMDEAAYNCLKVASIR